MAVILSADRVMSAPKPNHVLFRYTIVHKGRVSEDFFNPNPNFEELLCRHYDRRNIHKGLCMKEQRDCDVNGERDCKGHGEGSARSQLHPETNLRTQIRQTLNIVRKKSTKSILLTLLPPPLPRGVGVWRILVWFGYVLLRSCLLRIRMSQQTAWSGVGRIQPNFFVWNGMTVQSFALRFLLTNSCSLYFVVPTVPTVNR